MPRGLQFLGLERPSFGLCALGLVQGMKAMSLFCFNEAKDLDSEESCGRYRY